MLEAVINPQNVFTLDNELGTKIGGSTFDSSGKGHSASDLLSYAKVSNIKVAVYASVERVLLAYSTTNTGSKQQAIGVGVVYRDELGHYHHSMVRERGEVLPLLNSRNAAFPDAVETDSKRFDADTEKTKAMPLL